MGEAVREINRHDFVFVNGSGRLYAFGSCKEACGEAWIPHLEELILGRCGQWPIPAIVRRQDHPGKGMLQVGWSSWLWDSGSRFRIASAVPLGSVDTILSPYQVFERNERWPEAFRGLLGELRDLGENLGISLGLAGAAAMEALTGLPYLHRDSDLDLLLREKDGGNLQEFYAACTALSGRWGRKLDLELQLPGGRGVKLAEWLSDQRTVLVKGWDYAGIFEREELI